MIRFVLPFFFLLSCAGEPSIVQKSCEEIFSCGCEVQNFTGVETCVDHHEFHLSRMEAQAAALDLTFDPGCYLRQEVQSFECLGAQAFNLTYPGHALYAHNCGGCQFAFGTKQVGEPCVEGFSQMSDCAQGLVCQGYDQAECYDPCEPVVEGLRCVDGPCSVSLEDEGFICDDEKHICTRGKDGEPCVNGFFCGEGLWCNDQDLCETLTPALEGEACGSGKACVSGLQCSWEDDRCEPVPAPVGLGESCNPADCIAPYKCTSSTWTCLPLPVEGEPCLDRIWCADTFNCVDEICTKESPRVCW